MSKNLQEDGNCGWANSHFRDVPDWKQPRCATLHTCYHSIVCIHIPLAVLASQLPWQLPHLASQRLVWSAGENVDLGCVGQNTESLS